MNEEEKLGSRLNFYLIALKCAHLFQFCKKLIFSLNPLIIVLNSIVAPKHFACVDAGGELNGFPLKASSYEKQSKFSYPEPL